MNISNRDYFKRVLLITLLIVGLIGFWYFRTLWILGFASIVIAVGISIPANWLQQHGLKRGVAILISATAVIIGAVALMLLMVLPMTSEISEVLPQSQNVLINAGEVYDRWRIDFPLLRNFLPARDSSAILTQLGELVEQVNYQTLQDVFNAIFQTGSTLLPSLFKGLGFFFATLANLFFVVFIAIFLLVEPMAYIKASLYLVPERYHEQTLQIWSQLYQTLTAWITTQFLAVTMTMVLVWGALGLLGVPGAQTIALFAGLATFIPNIGSVLPLLPIAFFILVQPDPDPTLLLRAIPTYLLIQVVEGSILTPRLIKAQLNIPSGALLFFQVFASSIFGALGLLLAVPMLASLITLVREAYSYNLLKLRNKNVDIVTLDTQGTLALKMQEKDEPDEPIKIKEKDDTRSFADASSIMERIGSFRLFGHSDKSKKIEATVDKNTGDASAQRLTTTPAIKEPIEKKALVKEPVIQKASNKKNSNRRSNNRRSNKRKNR